MNAQSVLQIIVAIIACFGLITPAMYIWRGQRDRAKGDTTIAQVQSAGAVNTAHIQAHSILAAKNAELEALQYSKLWERVDRVEERASKNEERWQLRLSEMEKALSLSDAQRDSLVANRAELSATITLLTAQLAQVQGDLAQYKAQNAMVVSERDSLQAQLVEARQRITALEYEVARLGGKQ
jgi:chromosome segregation ATPase